VHPAAPALPSITAHEEPQTTELLSLDAMPAQEAASIGPPAKLALAKAHESMVEQPLCWPRPMRRAAAITIKIPATAN